MIKAVARSGNLAHLLRATSQAVGTTLTPTSPAVPEEEPPRFVQHVGRTTAYTASCHLPVKKITAVSGPTVSFSVRYNHFDAKVPDFSAYRRESRSNPNARSRDTEDNQKFYTTLVVGVGAAAAAYSAKATIVTFISSMAPSAAVLALAKIEVNLADIPEGQNVTFKWRGKPLFVRHRTQKEIDTEQAVELSSLRDPEHDKDRVKDPKWLVVVGVCTHLGCIPIANQGDWGGYYCPCHGSHYDASGRIRKGPAPLNLEVPPYELNGFDLVVG